MEKTSLFGGVTSDSSVYNDESKSIMLNIVCPVCGKIEHAGYCLNDANVVREYGNSYNKDGWIYEKVCDCCKTSSKAYKHCYTCKRPVGLREGVVIPDLSDSPTCEWCVSESNISNLGDKLFDDLKVVRDFKDFYNSDRCSMSCEGLDSLLSEFEKNVTNDYKSNKYDILERCSRLERRFRQHLIEIDYTCVRDCVMEDFKFKFGDLLD